MSLQTTNQYHISSPVTPSADLSDIFSFSSDLAESQFTPLQQSTFLRSQASSLNASPQLTEIQMSPPAGGGWEQICTSFVREVLASVSACAEGSRPSMQQTDVSNGGFGREIETTVHSLKAIATASTELAHTIPVELRVSLQSLGSLAETIRSSWSALKELESPEVKAGSGQGPISDLAGLLSSLTRFQGRVDEVARGLASKGFLTEQHRGILGTLGQTLHQSLIKLSGREVYAFARA